MKIDGTIGGRSAGGVRTSLDSLRDEVSAASRSGLSGVWSTVSTRDSFLPLVVAAQSVGTLDLGAAVDVAGARNPFAIGAMTYDLQGATGGRLLLGLGTSERSYLERRIGVPRSSPAGRVADLVSELRAMWAAWDRGEEARPDCHSFWRRHPVPVAAPHPHPYGPPRLLLAALGREMTDVAARVADGVIVHDLVTPRFLAEVVRPRLRAVRGTDLADFTVSHTGLVVTGRDELELAAAAVAVRAQVASFGATPAAERLFALHGWQDLHATLRRRSGSKEWTSMVDLVDDEVLETFAVVGSPEEVGRTIVHRYAGLVDRFTLSAPNGVCEEVGRGIVAAVEAATTLAA